MTSEDTRFKLSWSALQRFELCRQKNYLVTQGLSAHGKDARNFLAGNVVDSIQKAWLDDPKPGMMPLMVEEHLEKAIAQSEEKGTIKWRTKNDKAEIRKFCIEAATALEPILVARVLPYDYEPGHWFNVPVKIRNPNTNLTEEIVLRGEFDLLVRDPADGEFIIWDLKTTKDNDYWKKSLGQLVFYDLVCLSMFGKPPKKCGFIQPACDEQVKEFVFDNSHRSEMWGRIQAMVAAEWNNDHAPKADNVGCSFCEVVHRCEKFHRKLFTPRTPA